MKLFPSGIPQGENES